MEQYSLVVDMCNIYYVQKYEADDRYNTTPIISFHINIRKLVISGSDDTYLVQIFNHKTSPGFLPVCVTLKASDTRPSNSMHGAQMNYIAIQ